MTKLTARMPRPRIGLLPTGHQIYWGQFPGLREKSNTMLGTFRDRLEQIGDVVMPDLVDTPAKAVAAGELFQRERVDLVLIFPLGYTTGMVMVPAIQALRVPLRILNAHLDRAYDYASSDTAEYLYHEGPCCIPEYAGALVVLGKDFRVRTGHFHDERVTQLRSQSALAVSRLAALGRPGVTEGDVKTAMALKIMDLLGAGGMFVEFFAMDFDDPHLLLGHDGPVNINMAAGRPKLQHLTVQHGKTGQGLGVDFQMRHGPVTLLNLTEFGADDTFKLVYTVGEAVPGAILNIGNPNCRIKVTPSLHDFFDAWCQQGPCHHMAIGVGDLSAELETFAKAAGFTAVEI